MQIEIGDYVHFIGAEPVRCEGCSQDTADLTYQTRRGRVTLIDEMYTAIWPERQCNCGSQCGCSSTTDYSGVPEVRRIKRSFTLVLPYNGEMFGPMPEGALYMTEEDAVMAIDGDKIKSVVLMRKPETMMMLQVSDVLRDVPGEGSER